MNLHIEATNLDYLLLHQANDRILDKMAKKIGVDREKLPANMMEYGNTSAASIPILLSECVEQGLIRLDGSQTDSTIRFRWRFDMGHTSFLQFR